MDDLSKTWKEENQLKNWWMIDQQGYEQQDLEIWKNKNSALVL